MANELQLAVPERCSPCNTNQNHTKEATILPTSTGKNPFYAENIFQQYTINEGEATEKLIDEFFAIAKDNRINTKRSIAADIASTARVQKQNNLIIETCERELHRRDLTENQRKNLIEQMTKAAELSAQADEASRAFQKKQLSRSYALTICLWASLLLLTGGIGYAACIRSKT